MGKLIDGGIEDEKEEECEERIVICSELIWGRIKFVRINGEEIKEIDEIIIEEMEIMIED